MNRSKNKNQIRLDESQSLPKPLANGVNPTFAAIVAGVFALGGLGGYQYLKSDGYVNGKVLSQADAAFEAGELTTAMSLYKELIDNSDTYRQRAGTKVRKIVSPATLKTASTDEFAGALEVFTSFDVTPIRNLSDEVYELAISRIKESDIDTNDANANADIHKLLHAAGQLNEEGEDLSELDLKLVNLINAADPQNLEAAAELAQIYYLGEDLEKAKSVLMPVRDNLTDSEGARTLGQIFIAEGNNNEAYPLLSAYTSGRLKTLQIAEAEFFELQTELWDAQFNQLNAGSGPKSFYDELDTMSDAEQQLFVNEYIVEKLEANATYQAKFESYREAAAIVPVVMDFGILQLRTAEAETSVDARNAELKSAEETFLSIRNIVGDDDEYKLYLGQVYFWLGKQDDGQALFDEILASNGRSAEALLAVSSTLRNLGKVGDAGDLAQEAYDASTSDQIRYEAAIILQVMAVDSDDRIMWLERADPNSPYVQANLKEAQGHLAAEKGDTKAAEKLYREAIRYAETLPEHSTNFNNTALTYFALHRVNGDIATYQNGVELMSKAVDLSPENGILMGNASSTLITNALYETVGDEIDYAYLQTLPSISDISYHYTNAEEKDVLREKVKAHSDFQKGVSYLERAVLLSPNSAMNYLNLSGIYFFLDDDEAMSDLADKMANNKIDISALTQSNVSYVKGEDRTEELRKLKEREAYFVERLSARNLGKATKSALHAKLVGVLQRQIGYGESDAISKALEQAEQAVSLSASTYADSTLSDILLTQASIEAAREFPRYNDARERSLRNLSDATLVALWIGQDDEVADWLKSNTYVKRAIAIEVAEVNKFPKGIGAADWALLKAGQRGEAELLVENMVQSELMAAMHRIALIAGPMSGETLARDHWNRAVRGQPGIDPAKLAEAEKLGLYVPAQLFDQ